MQANRHGLPKQEKLEKTRNNHHEAVSELGFVVDRNRIVVSVSVSDLA